MSALVNYYGPGLTPTVLQFTAVDLAPVGVTRGDLTRPGTTEVVVAGVLLTETPTEGSAVLIPESIGADSAPKKPKASKKATEAAPATPAPAPPTEEPAAAPPTGTATDPATPAPAPPTEEPAAAPPTGTATDPALDALSDPADPAALSNEEDSPPLFPEHTP